MAIHKGEYDVPQSVGPRRARLRLIRLVALALPFACLAAYAARLPMPVPGAFLPRKTYADPAASVEAALKDAAGSLASVRVDSGRAPSKADVELARLHYESTGMPVSFGPERGDRGPLAAYSLSVSGDGSPSALTLLVDEQAEGPFRVSVDGGEALASPSLPADRRFTLPLAVTEGRSGAERVVRLDSGPSGAARSSSVTVSPPGADEPRILFVSRERGARSVLEALRPVRRIGYADLASAGLYRYELVVLDGPALSELENGLSAAIADYVERGAGSLLVVVDSADIGKPGDSPALERILPVELSPRSLSRLPDVAMAVAIDVSGSMYGDKLSLAKAVGMELLGNLKESDAAGILLFDEEARWLYPPAPVASLDAERSLAPLRAGGGTRLEPAVAACLAALEASSLPEKRVVVVSDGISAPADFDALAARAFRSGIAISTMAVGAEYDKGLLTRLAAGSGGRFYRVRDASEVPSLIIEDRKSVSRTVFAEERTGVVDIAGEPAGSIGGMARLGPKPDAVAFFSSEAGDPLLVSRRQGARSVLVYASDVYGRYGKEFLERPATLSVLDAVIGGLFWERPPSATVTETSDGLALSIRSDYLVAPRALVADEGGRIRFDAPFEAASPGAFFAAFGRLAPGRYTALVLDRGLTVARFALYSNGGTAAAPSDSAAAALAYRAPFWALPPGGAPWLIAFFALSLCSTLLLRMRP